MYLMKECCSCKGLVTFLALFSCIKESSSFTEYENKQVFSLDDDPISLTPYVIADLHYQEKYWKDLGVIPEINCTITTEYEGKGGVEAYFGLEGTSEFMRTIISKDNPATFFSKSRKIPDGTRDIPTVNFENNGCSVMLDDDVCANALRHNKPEITLKCKVE